MNWFLIALGAPILWALVNISDQYLVTKYTQGGRTSGALVLFSSLIGVIVALCIGLLIPHIFQVSLVDKLLLILSGFITVCWVILYFFALTLESVSGIVPWFLTIPIFGYILGYIFLGETLTQHQQIGSIIIILGVGLLTLNFSQERKSRFKWKTALYMIPACFLASIIGVIFKYVTVVDSFWVSSFWEYIGLGLAGIFIFIFVTTYRQDFMRMISTSGKIILSLNITSELLTIIGNLLTNYAVLLAPVVMVYLVGSFQPAIVIILTLIGTYFFPNIVTENTSTRVLVPKLIAIGIMVVGSVVLFI